MGLLLGLVFIAGSIYIISWNEGRTIKTHKGLVQGLKEVYTSQNINYVSPENEGKLLHLIGEVHSNETLVDRDFGIRVPYLKLQRNVEMYQWREKSEQRTIPGSDEKETLYFYDKTWAAGLHKSSQFKEADSHQNPVAFKFGSFRESVSKAKMGAHDLSGKQLARLNNWADFNFSEIQQMENTQLINREGQASTIFHGTGNFENPNIGDIRIKYKAIYPGNFSIVAKQKLNTFEAFKTDKDTEIDFIKSGSLSAKELFDSAFSQNTIIKWLLRVGSFILLFLGVRMLFNPITALASYIPLVRNIVNFGAGLISFILAFSIWLIALGLSWIYYRPLLGVILLAIAVLVVVLSSNRGKQRA